LSSWLFFSLGNKAKIALQVSIALTISFMIPLFFGWSQVTTAAVVVAAIASAGSVGQSFSKGLKRFYGTMIGAVLGLALVAIFPQDRFLYLFFLSIITSFFFYLFKAYQGDGYHFMIIPLVMMLMFDGGEVDDVFLYGLERSILTLFGVAIYTLIALLFFPSDKKESFDFNFFSGEYNWLDVDNFKTIIQLQLIFWFSVIFWIYVNPPGGFYIVIMAVIFGLYASFSPIITPKILTIILSVGFVFALFCYIFVLPNLTYPWELALFIFIYTFISYYFIPVKISLLFLMGLFLFLIENEMSYNFSLFLNILLMFYLFLYLLMIFRYFPFSTKPEDMFHTLNSRFFNYYEWFKSVKVGFLKSFFVKYMLISAKKLSFWIQKIDFNYYNKNSHEVLEEYVKRMVEFATMLQSGQDEKINESLIKLNESKKRVDFSDLRRKRF
jgi:hypothetical protein